MKKAKIIMTVDGQEYEYSAHPFETNEQKNRVNELAMKLREERGVPVDVYPCI